MPNKEMSTLSLSTSIALRLFYKNPYAKSKLDRYAKVEQKFTQQELYGSQCVKITCGLKSTGLAKITYINGLLIIRTNADMDILLSGHSPAYGVHIETAGSCAIVGGPALKLPVGLYIKSNRTVIDLPVSSRGFISFISNKDKDSWVEVNHPLTADKFSINTPQFVINANLVANSGGINVKAVKVTKEGKIRLKSNSVKALNFDNLDPSEESVSFRSVYLIWMDQIQNSIFNHDKSFLKSEKMIQEGKVSLENAVIDVKQKLHFVSGCTLDLNNVNVFGQGVQIDKECTVSGSNTTFQLKDQFDVDGTVLIAGLAVYSDTSSVCGTLWSDDYMHLQIRENASFHGIVGGKRTRVNGKHLLVSAIFGNEALCYNTFVNGGLIGTSALHVDVTTFTRGPGAYLFGPTMSITSGIDVGVLSYIRTYNLVKNCLYNFTSLEAELPCLPESIAALMNPNKLFRFAEMVGSKFPVLRGVVSAYNTAAFIGPMFAYTIMSALKSVYNDPNPLHQIVNFSRAGMSAAKYQFEYICTGLENIFKLARGEWNSSAVKEFIDVLLRANGLRIYGNTLMSQVTNTLVFVNDVQNHLASNSNPISNADNPVEPELTRVEPELTTVEPELALVKTEILTVNAVVEKAIIIAQEIEKVVIKEVNGMLNAPVSVFNGVIGTAETIKSIDLAYTGTKVLSSTTKQVDSLIAAGRAVINSEKSPMPIQPATVNETFVWDTLKETAKLLGPSIYSTSLVSNEGGLTITGSYIVNAGFYGNRGVVLANRSAIHSFFDINNSGAIFSEQHSESTCNRNNTAIVLANEIKLCIENNNERGTTEATTKMIFDINNQNISKGAKFKSAVQTFGHIRGNLVNQGTLDLRAGYLKHEGTTELSEISTTILKKMTLELDQEFNPLGTMDLGDSKLIGKKPAIFKNTSVTNTNNVLLHFPSIHRDDGSKFNIENTLALVGENVGSDLNSTLQGSSNSLLLINAKTVNELGSHAIGDVIYAAENLPSKQAYELAYGLGAGQNKTYTGGVLVSTQSTDNLTYIPSTRADGAKVTLLTKGPIVLPSSYERARGLVFANYFDAERFVAGYDGYELPEIPGFKKSTKQNFYEESTKACAAGVVLGLASFSLAGVGVAVTSFVTGLFTRKKAIKAANKEQARINNEIIRRANIYREIDERVTILDEKEDLAQLYNSYNNSKIDGLYKQLDVYDSNNIVTFNFTPQDLSLYKQDLQSSHQNRRLQSTALHDGYAKEMTAYFDKRRKEIRDSLGMSISIGTSTKFGADGYTVHGTYGTSFGGATVNGSLPIYDKTYTRSLPTQTPIEMPREQIYQTLDFPLQTIFEDLVFTQDEEVLSGKMPKALNDSQVKVDKNIDSEEPSIWNQPDSYSEANLKKSIDEFLSDPINRALCSKSRANSAKDIALAAAGSIAGLAQVVLLDTLELLDASELPYIMSIGASPYAGAKLQKVVNEVDDVIDNISTNGPMLLWDAYKSRYNEQMDESYYYAVNGNPYMTGFTSTRARAGIALDAVALMGLGSAAARCVPTLQKLGINTYNVATMGASRAKAANSMLDALNSEVNPRRLNSSRTSALTPEYNRVRTIANGAGHTNTGARSYNPVKHGFEGEEWARPIYEEIRTWNGAENIATISRNTGIPEQMIASVRQHVFFNEHILSKVNSKTGQMTIIKERFSPDAEIASLWDLASSQLVTGQDLVRFERLIAHEYIERGLMNIGYPYRSMDPRAIKFVHGDFILGYNRSYYGAHDMAPLSDYLSPAWKHHKSIGGFEPLTKLKLTHKQKN